MHFVCFHKLVNFFSLYISRVYRQCCVMLFQEWIADGNISEMHGCYFARVVQ
jgi:predicted DNA-binding ArsR family transcriptional regulator